MSTMPWDNRPPLHRCQLFSWHYSLWFFFFKQKTAYEMRISDWSSDVCSSDLPRFERRMGKTIYRMIEQPRFRAACDFLQLRAAAGEFDSVLAQWWMDLANGDDATRADMIEEQIGRAHV